MDKIKFKQFLNNLFFYFSLLIKVNINKSLHTGRALVLWVAITVTKMLPAQSDIRTLARKKLWRLGLQFPRSCMDKLILNADKNADKWILKKHKTVSHCYYSRRWMRHWWAPRTSNPRVRH